MKIIYNQSTKHWFSNYLFKRGINNVPEAVYNRIKDIHRFKQYVESGIIVLPEPEVKPEPKTKRRRNTRAKKVVEVATDE